MRMLVYGNSGSGKSTYARALATCHAAIHLDLDTIAWEPGQLAVPQPAANVAEALSNFTSANTDWIIEGC